MNQKNVYAAILAGGSGSRMGNPDKPKQFYLLAGKPILIHTLEKMCVTGLFDKVLVLCPETWLRQTHDIIERFVPQFKEQVEIVAGGATRNDTLINALMFLINTYPVDDDTVIVTHDAVRPFVTHRILSDNVDAVRQYGACDTVIPATDTIVQSVDAQFIEAIPQRSHFYQGQTPQSFRLLELKGTLSGLDKDEQSILTDAAKIYTLRNKPVALVQGDVINIKITYPQDIRIAESLIGD